MGNGVEKTAAATATALAETVAGRLAHVRDRVAAAAEAAGRDPAEVTIVAVSKTWPAEVVAAAVAAGQRHFGESRAQELRDKAGDPALRSAPGAPELVWHFVGRLQTNKVKYVVGTCALVHSVDRWDAAVALDERARRSGIVQPVLVQVNTSGDPAKAGQAPAGTAAFLERCAALGSIRVEGLMTIPALDADPAGAYAALRALRDEAVAAHPRLRHLSMGMSRDYEVAVREGATIVRVGEAIFGRRRR